MLSGHRHRKNNHTNTCCQISNIRHTLVGNKIVDHSDVVGASPVGSNYRKISDIRCTKSLNLNVSHLGLQLSLRNILKPSVGWRLENEDVVGAVPTGDAPTTFE